MVANQKGVDMAINFTVNGKPASVSARGNTRLLWVLREELKLTGTNSAAAPASAAPCMVHIDARAHVLPA